ncbi:hypothetical protein VIGAN_01273400 [Vigna angularis var. angularis]|uniref:Uncharacterized protein n=1 Tax=Vigna angularis var. angularis TaxID=157739 RepID=A0A0S3R2W3_PHAAN|nr:hypothetical protein VIGAN_01273400 [Vigna angularis var. angularis]
MSKQFCSFSHSLCFFLCQYPFHSVFYSIPLYATILISHKATPFSSTNRHTNLQHINHQLLIVKLFSTHRPSDHRHPSYHTFQC